MQNSSNVESFLKYAFIYTNYIFLCVPTKQIVHIFNPIELHTLKKKIQMHKNPDFSCKSFLKLYY